MPDKDGTIKDPEFWNLRESGQIEQDADFILFVWRRERNNLRAQRRVKIAKNKDGITGTFLTDFIGANQRFVEAKELAQMPNNKRKTSQTPVVSKPQEEYQQITTEDPNLPF